MPSPLAVSVSEYAGTQREFPAEIFSWLMRKYLNQVHSFQKLASLNAKCCDFARRADFHDEAAVLYFARHAGVRLCEIKICTVPVHGLSAPKFDWSLPKTWKDVLHPARPLCNPKPGWRLAGLSGL